MVKFTSAASIHPVLASQKSPADEITELNITVDHRMSIKFSVNGSRWRDQTSQFFLQIS